MWQTSCTLLGPYILGLLAYTASEVTQRGWFCVHWLRLYNAHSLCFRLLAHEAWVAVTRAWSKLYASHVWLALPISNKLNNTLKRQPEELRICDSEEFLTIFCLFLFASLRNCEAEKSFLFVYLLVLGKGIFHLKFINSFETEKRNLSEIYYVYLHVNTLMEHQWELNH